VTGPVGADERQRILALAQDLPALWHAAATTPATRKQLLRCLVKDVTITKREATIQLGVRWQTDACTTVEIPRPPRSCDLRRTPPATVERIRQLAPAHTDAEIALALEAEGHRPGLGGQFTAAKVQ